MGIVADGFKSVFRRFTTDGVASSGPNKPSKDAASSLGATIESAIAAGDAALSAQISAIVSGRATTDVQVANAAALPSHVYANGTAGAGATLTGSANGALAAIDGVTLTVGQRLWYWDPAATPTASVEFGIYVVTTLGDAGTKFVLTRVTDADTSSELGYVRAYVKSGTVNGGRTLYVPVAPGSLVVGTTAFAPVIVDGPTGSAALLASFSNAVSRLTVSGGTANALQTTGSQPLTSYSRNLLYVIYPTQPNTDVVTVNDNGLGAVPLIAGDYTALDPGVLDPAHPLIAMYEDALATPSLRIIWPDVSATSARRLAMANSYTVVQSVSTPASRYTETGKTQTGSTLTLAALSPPLFIARGFPASAVLSSDIIISEHTVGGTIGANDAIIIGGQATPYAADNQTMDSSADVLAWFSSGGISFFKGDGTEAEDFSGQVTPEEIEWVAGDVLRVEVFQGAESTGGQIMLFRNGNFIAHLTFETTTFVGKYPLAGMRGETTGCAVTTAFTRHARITPGTSRTVTIDTNAGSEGIGTRASAFKTPQEAIRRAGYTSDHFDIVWMGLEDSRGSIGMIPVYSSLRIRGANAVNPVTFRASTLLEASSGSFSKTSGKTNVYEIAASFAGLTNSRAGNCGFIGVGGNPNQAVGAAGKGNVLSHYLYTDLGSCSNATLSAKLTALDSAPGSFTNNTDTGVIYINAIGSGGTSVDPDTLDLEMVSFNSAFYMPNDINAYQYMPFEMSGVDFGFSSSNVVEVQRVKLDWNNVTARGSLRANGFCPDTSPGNLKGVVGYGNAQSGLDTSGNLTSPDLNRDFWTLVLDDSTMYGNIANRGAVAHTGTRFLVVGGKYNGNGQSGIAGNCVDVSGGVEMRGNGISGIFYPQLANQAIDNTLSGAVIEDNGDSGIEISSGGLTTGSMTVRVGGGTKVAGNVAQNVKITGTASHASATAVRGALLKSGTAPSAGDVNNVGGNATVALVQPTYI